MLLLIIVHPLGRK